MSDDLPWAEFAAPKMIFNRNVKSILAALEKHRESPLTILEDESGPDWAQNKARVALRHEAHLNDYKGLQHYYGGLSFEKPEEMFRASLQMDPNDSNAIYYLSEILVHKSRIFADQEDKREEVLAMLLDARSIAPFRSDIHKLLGDTYFDLGNEALSRASYLEHIRLGGVAPIAQERTQ